jgi:hypothetical protein
MDMVFLEGDISDPIDRLNTPMSANGLGERLRLDEFFASKGAI